MNPWTFYTVELISGDIVIDLPVTDFGGEVSLIGGGMTAKVPLLHLDAAQRQAVLESTIPGRYSIIAVYEDVIVGEWIIWQRNRANDLDPLDLSGRETMSFLERRVMPGRTYTQIEQLDIASDLIVTGFGPSPQGNGAVAVSVGAYTASGQKRDRVYAQADGTIGQRVKELGEVINGFDWYIKPVWTGTSGTGASVARTANLLYPRAGSASGLFLEDRNILSFQLSEDATRLASRTYAIGDSAAVRTYEDDALITTGRMPFLEKTGSYTSVEDAATLDSYAHSMWDDAQLDMLPADMTILADSQPGIGDFSLGDVVTVVLEESINFPVGLRVDVRILSWAFKPATSGVETLSLGISQEGPVGDYTGNPIPIG
jgi:hypothetical protein